MVGVYLIQPYVLISNHIIYEEVSHNRLISLHNVQLLVDLFFKINLNAVFTDKEMFKNAYYMRCVN